MTWETTDNSLEYYGRGYMYWPANPEGTWAFLEAQQEGLRCWACTISTAGIIEVLDASSTPRITFSTEVALNQWTRIEWHASHPTNTIEVKLFNNAESDTPTESHSSSAGLLRTTGANTFMFSGGRLGDTMWWDDIVANALSYPGPYSADDHDPNPDATLTYTVRNFFGKIVSTGTFSEADRTLTPEVPHGGWKNGWYRVYLTGPQSDANFADSYGVTNFCVIRSNPHFVAMPAGNTPDQSDKDFVMKGVMGLSTSRMTISTANDPDAEVADIQAWKTVADMYWSDNGLPDPRRPARENWVAFSGRTWDQLIIDGASTGTWGNIYLADSTLDGDQVFVTVSAGTNANTDKVTVHYPNAVTLVETYDNLVSQAAAETEINGASTKIRFFGSDSVRAAHPAQAAMGDAFRSGVISSVATLYADGITRFEGPVNEGTVSAEGAHQMKLFQGAVHAGNSSAKAIGPCFVSIPPAVPWTAWLDAGGGDYCDEISFHAYNFSTNGDINLGRATLQTFTDALSSAGLGSKPLWQTESTQPFNSVFKVYHPRRSRRPVLSTLLFEEIGCPRERNVWWYDISHGFWDYPAFVETMDGSLGPEAVMGRVLAEETWGKTYESSLDFGGIGNNLYLGTLYTAEDGSSCMVLMATSYMTGASVALSVIGSSDPLTVVDGMGNEKQMVPSRGRITVPMTDIPAYVRLPAGVSVTVYRVNGWSPLGVGGSVSPAATTKEIDGVTYDVIADDEFITNYSTGAGIAPPGVALEGPYATTPGTDTLVWEEEAHIERVVVWCGSAWQASGTLIDFDVETYDGAEWTVRKTVTKSDPPWFYFGSGDENAGCFVETYWDEQWIFDVELDEAVDCFGVRLNVRQAAYGGEPLPCPVDPWQHGQGTPVEAYKIQEIAVVDSNRYTTMAA